MGKKIGIVIGASRDAIHTIQKAREYGVYIIALDGNPKAEGFDYADESIQVDISNREETLNIVKRIKPNFVLPIPIGKYLSTTGYINEELHMKGIKQRATEVSTDKFEFHEVLHGKGLRPVKAYLVNRETDISKLDMLYPVIMKPRYGSGSRDVFYITNDEELNSAIEQVQLLNEDFVLEQAVEGDEYGVDGAVINGKFMLTLLRKKIITPLPVRQAVSSLTVVNNTQNEKLLNEVKSFIQRLVSVLDYNDCLLNADLIINSKGIFVIEMAPRPSGHNLHNVFVPLATGIDIAEEYIKFLLGQKFQFETPKVCCLQIRFFDFENVFIKRVPKEEELKINSKCKLVMWACNIQDGTFLEKVINGHSIMGRGFFVIEGTDESSLLKQSEWILSQFQIEQN